MAKRNVGRPSKLNPENVKKMLDVLRMGNYRNVAASFAGISHETLAEWMTLGKKDPSSVHGEFRRQVIEAEKTAEIRNVTIVQTAAKTDAKHAEWWLSRKFPARWAKTEKQQISGPNGEAITVNINKLSMDDVGEDK